MKAYNIFILIFGVFVLQSCGNSEENKENTAGPRRASVLTVQGVVVQPTTLSSSFSTTGTIKANEIAEIRSETTGRITSINFAEGTYVSKGKVLIEIESDELNAQLQKVKVELGFAEQTLERTKKLYAADGISKEALDQAITSLESLKADQVLIQAQLAKRTINAPFSGQIGLREVSPGSYLSPSDLITTIQDDSKVKIEFKIPEQYAYKIKLDQEITFRPNGVLEYTTAKISNISNTIDHLTRTLTVRALVNNTSKKFKVGSFAEINIDFESIEDAISVPAQTLIPQIEGYAVFKSVHGKTFVQPVQTGIRSEDAVQITSGLMVGDTVITTGLLGMKADMNVIVNLSEK